MARPGAIDTMTTGGTPGWTLRLVAAATTAGRGAAGTTGTGVGAMKGGTGTGTGIETETGTLTTIEMWIETEETEGTETETETGMSADMGIGEEGTEMTIGSHADGGGAAEAGLRGDPPPPAWTLGGGPSIYICTYKCMYLYL